MEGYCSHGRATRSFECISIGFLWQSARRLLHVRRVFRRWCSRRISTFDVPVHVIGIRMVMEMLLRGRRRRYDAFVVQIQSKQFLHDQIVAC